MEPEASCGGRRTVCTWHHASCRQLPSSHQNSHLCLAHATSGGRSRQSCAMCRTLETTSPLTAWRGCTACGSAQTWRLSGRSRRAMPAKGSLPWRCCVRMASAPPWSGGWLPASARRAWAPCTGGHRRHSAATRRPATRCGGQASTRRCQGAPCPKLSLLTHCTQGSRHPPRFAADSPPWTWCQAPTSVSCCLTNWRPSQRPAACCSCRRRG